MLYNNGRVDALYMYLGGLDNLVGGRGPSFNPHQPLTTAKA